jgi:thiamine pyrophosphokinase
MKLPTPYIEKSDWTLVGPMGPHLPRAFMERPVLAVDGGANFTSQVDLWIGDADSGSAPKDAVHVFTHPMDKKHSDFALALALFEKGRPFKMHLWGFLGGRRDHELFNFGEARNFLESRPGSHLIFYDLNGAPRIEFFGAGDWSISHQGLFSLGTLTPVKLGLSGECRWPIDQGTLVAPLSSFGLSNEATGKLRLINEGAVFLHWTERI